LIPEYPKETVKPNTLYRIDENILTIDGVICRHIENLPNSPRGAVSQDILSHLRNFVEQIMLKFYADGQDIKEEYEKNEYETICKAISFVKTRGGLRNLSQFHKFLQIVASHYTLSEENSERLMLKYYEYLLKVKNLLHDKFGLNVLSNLEKFPISTDSNLQEYYDKIADKINQYSAQSISKSEKYYIQKIRPFFANHQIYYEVTFAPANDYVSKFNRVIAFTKLEVTDFYAVKFSLANTSIEIFGKIMPITIITDWEVAIRNCEFKNFTSIIRGWGAIPTHYSEQQGICRFLTETGLNLVELIELSDSEFQEVKQNATQKTEKVVFFDDLEYCRTIIKKNEAGSNLLRYLLYHMNNKVIKSQRDDYWNLENSKMSNLYVKYGCIPFDDIPFNFSPVNHNPKLGDLFACIDTTDRQHEILARLIRNNTEIQGQLFTPVEDIIGFGSFENIKSLIERYNSALYYKHKERNKLIIENDHIFINGYLIDTCSIISELEKLSKNGIQNYANSVETWLNGSNYIVDCEEKKNILIQIFENSQVALVHGSAGTGKSTLINHIAHFFADKKKLFLAQTNPAVDNLKRRVNASNCKFLTISKFLKKQETIIEYDILIIDECSTVSNNNMYEIISKAIYNILILVGDSYQIESINFGNWFSISNEFVSKTSVSELIKPYRSNDYNLLTLWDRVRKMDDTILELITRRGYSTTLDASIFTQDEEDEIILCLNYDGLYGINNINHFLQESNTGDSVHWGIQQYKTNDPILFNESTRFTPVIYNNMKGWINRIEILDTGDPTERIQFDIELDKIINGMDALGQDFELLENADNGNSIIRFCVYKTKDADEDDEDSSRSVVPFQVAYAVSIHKAQGLEYDSVKIVITDEIDELITHNIFYTAITRARKNLKIYWTPEVEQKVLTNIKPRNIGKDVALLKNYIQSNSR